MGDRSLAPAVLVHGITDVAPPGSTHEHVADESIAVIIQIESPVSSYFSHVQRFLWWADDRMG
jgi:hypothetical protein